MTDIRWIVFDILIDTIQLMQISRVLIVSYLQEQFPLTLEELGSNQVIVNFIKPTFSVCCIEK